MAQTALLGRDERPLLGGPFECEKKRVPFEWPEGPSRDFLIAVQEATGVDIPEADYPKLRLINELEAYLRLKLSP